MVCLIQERLKGFHRDIDCEGVVRATLQNASKGRDICKVAPYGKTNIVNARAAPTITVVGGVEIVPRFCALNRVNLWNSERYPGMRCVAANEPGLTGWGFS
jgi:hypothetical protein